jgi:Cu/Ag efflux pump CusA
MAVVILGGIVTSTALNMVVIPALVLRYGGLAARMIHHERVYGRNLTPSG